MVSVVRGYKSNCYPVSRNNFQSILTDYKKTATQGDTLKCIYLRSKI